MKIHAGNLDGNRLWEKVSIMNGMVSVAYKVVGVVKNFSYRSPTSKPGLIAFQHPKAQDYLLNRASILFKFREGTGMNAVKL